MTTPLAKPSQTPRVLLIACVTLATLAHLGWEYFNGGIKRHHFLAQADMPAFSNAWGLLLLPLLAWFAGGRIQNRITRGSSTPAGVVAGFAGALLAGGLLSISFTSGDEATTGYIFIGLIALALLLPVCRAECVLGFVLGMMLTFGAVLPLLIGSVIATLSAIVRLGVRTVVRWISHAIA